MLKYLKIALVSAISLVALGIFDLFLTINIWYYICIILATAGFLAYGSASVRSGFYLPAVCSFETEGSVMALTFDDGPDRQITPLILDILKKNNVKALFFCIGEKASREKDLVKRIVDEGHAIGNHSHTHHVFFDLFSRKRILAELDKNERILEEISGRKIKMFRPPYGVTNPTVAWAVKKGGYQVIGWSVRSKDTVIREDELLFKRLANNLGKGRIFLFHDTMPITARVLEGFINFARDKKYSFERLDLILNNVVNE